MLSLMWWIEKIGVVWPLEALAAIFMAAETGFALVMLGGFSLERRKAEADFIATLREATNLASTTAILAGMLGTYWGLAASLGPLADIVKDPVNAAVRMSDWVKGMENAFYSSVGGLIVGGLWGGLNLFFLHLVCPTHEHPAHSSLGYMIRRLLMELRRLLPMGKPRASVIQHEESLVPEGHQEGDHV